MTRLKQNREGSDFADHEVQARLISHVNKVKPELIIGSPPCTLFPGLQQLNLHAQGSELAADVAKRRLQAEELISFFIRLFRLRRNRADLCALQAPREC